MRTNNRQCHGDRRDGESSSPENAGGMEAESRQLGTEKQKGSAWEVRGFAVMVNSHMLIREAHCTFDEADVEGANREMKDTTPSSALHGTKKRRRI
jgi:hypothetical protein